MAIPHPQDVLQSVERMAAKGLPPVTFVVGSNDYFRHAAVEALLAAVPKDAELRIVDGVEIRAPGGRGAAAPADDNDDSDDSHDAGESDTPDTGSDGINKCPELQELRGGGLFARQAFVVVRRAKNWWLHHAETLAEQLASFGKGSGIIVEAPKLDRRKKVAATLFKQTAEAGAVFEFRDLYLTAYGQRDPLQGELTKWVQTRSAKLGVPLTLQAACLIVVRTGTQPAELAAELQRLRDQLGGGPQQKPLTPEDLRDKLNLGFESNPFELAEAVLGGDGRAALRSVRAMFARGVRGRDGRPMDQGGLFPFATSWLFQCMTRAYEGRLLLDEGVSPRDLPGRLGVRQFADRFLAEVQSNDRAKLRHGLLALHHCQRMSRTQGEEPEVLLERFLVQWFDGAPVPTAGDLEL